MTLPAREAAADTSLPGGAGKPLLHPSRYRRLLIIATVSISLTAVVPLVVMALVNYHQYRDAFHAEQVRPVARITSNAKRSLELFLSERISALLLVIREKSPESLANSAELNRLLRNMKQSFGGFVDLGLIDGRGIQVSYAGPYKLKGRNYREQEWYHAVQLRGVYVSDVFMGYRNFPHFVIAVRDENLPGGPFVLRATIDTETINRQILNPEPQVSGDAFLINRQGILQTPSANYGSVLGKCPLPVPAFAPGVQVVEAADEKGRPVIEGYAYVDRSPFIVMELTRPGTAGESWLSLRRELAGFAAASVLLILGVVFWGTRFMVERIREADMRRAALFHKAEYTNKMAAIGRLGAGVAHEINNPLAIINEKAGLLRDLLTMPQSNPPREKLVGLVDSVLNSVERCSRITHRLLGFARQMDVHNERIELDVLLRDVFGFLEKDAIHRGVRVTFDVADGIPPIVSDRGQLQQVFLNILNNAFAAVSDGGIVSVAIRRDGADSVAVEISDNGIGIPADDLEHIFEPFFTTKRDHGTGLGLSITYGIVGKLGGRISVDSREGEGARFTVVLPVGHD